MTAATEKNHAEDQARAQLESIVEMVAALDEDKSRDAAIAEYIEGLTDEQVQTLAKEASIIEPEDRAEGLPVDAMRERIKWEMEMSNFEPDDFSFEFDDEEARQTIQEDALSVQVRGAWHSPGDTDVEDDEFEILLCTGGPAVRIVGDLNSGSPDRPRLEYQDWFTSWTELIIDNDEEREALQTYCEQFYFGD